MKGISKGTQPDSAAWFIISYRSPKIVSTSQFLFTQFHVKNKLEKGICGADVCPYHLKPISNSRNICSVQKGFPSVLADADHAELSSPSLTGSLELAKPPLPHQWNGVRRAGPGWHNSSSAWVCEIILGKMLTDLSAGYPAFVWCLWGEGKELVCEEKFLPLP